MNFSSVQSAEDPSNVILPLVFKSALVLYFRGCTREKSVRSLSPLLPCVLLHFLLHSDRNLVKVDNHPAANYVPVLLLE